MQTVEIIAGRAQSLKEIQPVFFTGDQTRDLGGAALYPAAVGRENRDRRMIAAPDMHGVIDALRIAPGEILEAAKVVGRHQSAHRDSLPRPPSSIRTEVIFFLVVAVPRLRLLIGG